MKPTKNNYLSEFDNLWVNPDSFASKTEVRGFPLDFLPPELRRMIMDDLERMEEEDKNNSGGSGGETSTDTDKAEQKKAPVVFDFAMTNCNQDLAVLTEKLKASKMKNYGILLWGVSGSGKSYYGQYLAQELGMPMIKKRASDLVDKYVGTTEKNIRDAFAEAKKQGAILLFDEADSFLFDRKYAKQDFQAAHVNEILTQMEDHPYPFIMTTNLHDKIDRAALRRFIFKIKYDYMKAENVAAGIKTYFGKKFKLTTEQLSELTHLCAGDFKVVKQKMDILENGEYSNEAIFNYLMQELVEKEIEKGSASISI